MAFARSDLGCSVVESSLLSLNEVHVLLSGNMIHRHCYDCSSIDCRDRDNRVSDPCSPDAVRASTK